MDHAPQPATIYTLCPLSPENAEIRLLKVEVTDSADGALRCAFYKTSLNQQAPAYTAVSYCWGQAEHDHAIYVGPTAVKVTETVEDVLREVLVNGAAFVWIDQVCIDQGNTAERNNQVAMMSVIYSRAACVLTYLGKSGEHTSLAIDFAEHYRLRMKDQGVAEDQIADVSTSESVSFVAPKKPDPPPDSEVLRQIALGLADLLSRPFFKRLWVVQEVVLAKNLVTVCGSRHFQWYVLRLACLLFTRRPELAALLKSFVHINCDFATLRKASRLVREHRNLVNRDLWRILDECSGLATSEPRDKIYAVLGLAGRTSGLPKPDYAKSIKAVFIEFARHFVQHGHGIDIIEAAIGSDHQREVDYPSWAPWFDAMDASKLKRTISGPNAAATTNPVIWLGRFPLDILAHGAIIDRVIAVGPRGPRRGEHLVRRGAEHDIFLEWIERSRVLLQSHDIASPAASLTSVLLQESPKISQEGCGSAHLRLVDASEEVLSQTLFNFMDSLRTMSGRSGLRSRLMTFRFDQGRTGSGHIILLNDFAYQAIGNLTGQRVFVTTHNRVGIASNAIEVGDDIAILGGGRTPYVLREKWSSEQVYSLVTWAYVQGIMHGEALHERHCHMKDLTIR